MKAEITKRDGLIIIKHVKPVKKKTGKKRKTVSGIPTETVENVKE